MKLTKYESLLMPEVTDDIGDAEEDLAASVLEDFRFKEWVSAMRETYIVKGFFTDWYGIDGRLSRVKERKSKGNFLFKEERSAFLLWLRIGTDAGANNLWHETMDILKTLNMDFSEYSTRMMFPLFSRRYVADIFEAVGRSSHEAEALFREVFPFLAPPPWFELLNYAIFDRFLFRLPIYRIDFTDDLKLGNITFLQPDLSEIARSWLIKEVSVAYEKLIAGQERSGNRLEWWFQNNLKTPVGIRDIARKYGKPASTVSAAVKAVNDNLSDENKLEEYMRTVPTVGGLSWTEAFEIANKTYFTQGAKEQSNHGEELSPGQEILFLMNIAQVGDDMISTKNYSKLGVRPIPHDILRLFVHQKMTK